MPFQQITHWISLNLRYFGKPPWDTGQSPVELISYIHTHTAGKALDLGCGTGTNCLTLAKGGWQVTGIDLAWRAIWLARRKFKAGNLEGRFLTGDLLSKDFPDSEFDLILDMGCFHSLPAGSRALYREKIFHWLKPGGVFLNYGHRLSANHLSATSLSDDDITGFMEYFDLTDRKDCQDQREREAVWLWFRKPER